MKQQTKIFTILLMLGVVGSFFIGMTLSLLTHPVFYLESDYPEGKAYPQIYFDNLSEPEKAEINKIINSLKEDYALILGKVHFTKDKDLIDSLCDTSCWGINTRYIEDGAWKSEIYVYAGNMRNVKGILCHELLHNIVKLGEDYHKFVYDLTEESVCYR